MISQLTVLWIRKLKIIFLCMGLTNAFLLCKSDHHNFLFLHTAHDQNLDSWMTWYTVFNGENSQSLHRNKNVCSIFYICFFSEPFDPPSALRYTLARSTFTYVEPTSPLFVHTYCKWSKRQSSTYHICVLVCLREIQPGAEDLYIQVHMHLKRP